MMKVYWKIVSLGFCLWLAGCSLLSPVDSKPKNSYLLSYQSVQTIDNVQKKSMRGKRKIILVAPVTAVPWLDTTRMAYQTSQEKLDYFALNQWAAKPAELLQPIIMQVLQSSGEFKAVVASPYNGSYDRKLEINILDFQQVFIRHPSEYLIHFQARVIQYSTQKVLFSKEYRMTMPCESDDPQGGVVAANRIISQLVPLWSSLVNAKGFAQ